MTLLDSLPEGTRIDKYGAMMAADYLACETVKARALRALPAHVLQKRDNGRFPAEKHPLEKVLHRPNALMSWGDLIAWAVIYRDTFGYAVIKVYRNGRGEVSELRPVTARVFIKYDRERGIAIYSAANDDMNEAWTCREDDLVILKTDISEDGGITGKSIAQKAANDIGLSVDLTKFYRAIVNNGNHFTGWLETDQSLRREDIDALRKSLDNTGGADEAGRIRIFDRGLTYHPVSVALDGMDIVNQEKFVLDKVCRACHVDPHHVYNDSAITSTSATGADIDFVKNTVLPEVTSIEQAFQPLLDRARSIGGSDSGYRLKLDMNGLLRGDFKTRMDGYRIAVYAGIFTRAYCATCEDVPWQAGQDRLLQPTAYYTLDEDGNPTIPAEPTQGTSGQSDGQSGQTEKRVTERLNAVLRDATERITKRARADGDTEKTRDFARKVIDPIALLCAECNAYVNPELVIEDAIEKGIHGED